MSRARAVRSSSPTAYKSSSSSRPPAQDKSTGSSATSSLTYSLEELEETVGVEVTTTDVEGGHGGEGTEGQEVTEVLLAEHEPEEEASLAPSGGSGAFLPDPSDCGAPPGHLLHLADCMEQLRLGVLELGDG